jgi:hypothetical protein
MKDPREHTAPATPRAWPRTEPASQIVRTSDAMHYTVIPRRFDAVRTIADVPAGLVSNWAKR